MESQPPTRIEPRAAGNDCPVLDTDEVVDVEDIERELELDDEEFNWYLGE